MWLAALSSGLAVLDVAARYFEEILLDLKIKIKNGKS